jgi:hypothetical protein
VITAIVRFKLPAPVSRDRAREMFEGTAPKYLKAPGLIRKYYLISDDGATAGGVYLWESREAAERLYTAQWRQFVSQTYGTEPSLEYFGTPVVVDNLAGSIIKDG